MAIKVVVDTNVLVAGLIGGKRPNREVLRRYLNGELVQVLAEEETKQRFMAAKLRGNPNRALQLLDELDGLGA